MKKGMSVHNTRIIILVEREGSTWFAEKAKASVWSTQRMKWLRWKQLTEEMEHHAEVHSASTATPDYIGRRLGSERG